MQAAKRWLVWRKDGSKKVPYWINGKIRRKPLDGSRDIANLAAFDDALAVVENYDGLGFALGRGWHGIDLDCPKDSQNQKCAELRAEFIDWAKVQSGYGEWSPNLGIHILGFDPLLKFKFASYLLPDNGGKIEAWSEGHFITVTGDALTDKEPGNLGVAIAYAEARNPNIRAKAREGGLGALEAPAATLGNLEPPKPLPGLSDDQAADLASALGAIPPNVKRDVWIAVLCGLKSVNAGKEIAESWSSGSTTNYILGEIDHIWDGLPTHSYKTLFNIAEGYGWHNPKQSLKPLPTISHTLFQPTNNDPKMNKWPVEHPSVDQWESARPYPTVIISNFLYSNVGLFVAPGGMGKTTFLLYMSLHIALGLPFLGMPIERPGRVLFVTAEDGAEQCVYKLNQMCQSLALNQEETYRIRNCVLISDVSGSNCRLTENVGNCIKPNIVNIARLCDLCALLKPTLIIFDPAMSFGVGERFVNDAEQALIEAGRVINRHTNACVLFVHHTGKENARLNRSDVYAYRGGSALADGSRMVLNLSQDGSGDSGLKLTVAKLTYARRPEPIKISRSGYCFHPHNYLSNIDTTAMFDIPLAEKQIIAAVAEGTKYTKNTLFRSGKILGSRKNCENAIDGLLKAGQVVVVNIPGQARGARSYLALASPLAAPPSAI